TGGVHLEVGVSGSFTRSEEEGEAAPVQWAGSDYAGFDDAFSGRGLAHFGATEQVVELVNPGFLLGLFLTGRVVTTVLLEVALFAGGLDLVGDLGPSHIDEVVVLGLQAVIGILRQPRGFGHGSSFVFVMPARSCTDAPWTAVRNSGPRAGYRCGRAGAAENTIIGRCRRRTSTTFLR